MSQFQKHHPRVVAAFETRARAGSFETEHLFVYSSGASKGSYGTQIWVARGEHYAIRGDHLKDFMQIDADPRRLVGIIFSKHADFHIAALHAPHSESNCDVNAWWDETLALLDGLSDLAILTDANATLGTETSSAVGHFGAEPENLCGDRFHELPIELQAFLPATSADIEHQKIWFAIIGQGKFKHRLECVALRVAWQNAISNVSTITDIDLLNKDEDHHAQPTVTITYDTSCSNSRNKCRSNCVNAHKSRDTPGALQKVIQHSSHAPTDDWWVPVDQHAMNVHNIISNALLSVSNNKQRYKRNFSRLIDITLQPSGEKSPNSFLLFLLTPIQYASTFVFGEWKRVSGQRAKLHEIVTFAQLCSRCSYQAFVSGGMRLGFLFQHWKSASGFQLTVLVAQALFRRHGKTHGCLSKAVVGHASSSSMSSALLSIVFVFTALMTRLFFYRTRPSRYSTLKHRNNLR